MTPEQLREVALVAQANDLSIRFGRGSLLLWARYRCAVLRVRAGRVEMIVRARACEVDVGDVCHQVTADCVQLEMAMARVVEVVKEVPF